MGVDQRYVALSPFHRAYVSAMQIRSFGYGFLGKPLRQPQPSDIISKDFCNVHGLKSICAAARFSTYY